MSRPGAARAAALKGCQAAGLLVCVAAVLSACGAAGAPEAPGSASPRAPEAVTVLRTPVGWRLEVTPPRLDADGEPLPADLRIAVFEAASGCLGPPRFEAAAGAPVLLPREATGAYELAAYAGRRLGSPVAVNLPAHAPPPPPPEAPLAFRRDDGVVELTFLPPVSAEADRLSWVVLRGDVEIARLPASLATYADETSAGRAPLRYGLAVRGADFQTAPSVAVEVP